MRKGLFCLFLAVCVAPTYALGPHEVLVLANEAFPDSVGIAREYMGLRGIPAANFVRLRVPPDVVNSKGFFSPGNFKRLVWSPANKAMRERGVDGHILAWVYSVGFPVGVRTKPPISLMGATFLRNKLPEPDQVRNGSYVSPLFAGPERLGAGSHFSQTFDSFREWLGPEMPLPSMMLGYLGVRGNRSDEVRACLRRGVLSDGTKPTGTVFFVGTESVRSKCRHWQFPAARAELISRGIDAVLTTEYPSGRNDIIGMMIGAKKVATQRNGYPAGAIAENLTSAGAVFGNKDHTKVTHWIAAGATASSGTVTEPYAIWTKFPNARLFVHYASGCTAIESFYQAIRCPLQILIVGEPLANPWADDASAALKGLPDGEASGTLELTVSVNAPKTHHYGKFSYLVDGRPAGAGRTWQLDTTTLPDGEHSIRAVACRTGLVRAQVFDEKTVTIRNGKEQE